MKVKNVMGEFNYKEVYNSWKWNIPEKYNIGYDCVDKHTDTDRKNKIALYWEDSEGNTDKFTYNDMKNLTNKFGNVLRNLGFKKGDRFLIRLPNIPAFQISFLGGVKIGAVPIPSSVMFRAHEVEFVDELPKTQSGKIKRKQLRELEIERKLGGMKKI